VNPRFGCHESGEVGDAASSSPHLRSHPLAPASHRASGKKGHAFRPRPSRGLEVRPARSRSRAV
jgi:hypothetical protein